MSGVRDPRWRNAQRRGENRFRSSRSTATVNGWMLIVASPVLFFGGMVSGVKEYGPVWGVLAGLASGLVFLVPGVLLVRTARQMKRPVWLESLRVRGPEDVNAEQPPGPPPAA